MGKGIYRDITVVNEYDERLWLEVDKPLEDMSILLDFPLPIVDDMKILEKWTCTKKDNWCLFLIKNWNIFNTR